MIRYQILPSDLETAIEKEKKGWLAAAAKKTAAFRAAKDFTEPARQNSWSQIKSVFMQIQHNKCAYCERRLGSQAYGKGEHDIEHFRPKNAVKAWPTEKMKQSGKYDYGFATGEATDKGYYLLAYNIFNYTTACKSCNTSLKSNYFPIAGKRVGASDDFDRLKKEKPFLIYPLGQTDDDPEELITFHGILPVPKFKSGHRYRRARVTIDFFDLDTREELLRLRAEVIQKIWLAFIILNEQQASNEARKIAQQIIDRALSSSIDQAACARAFYRLCQEDHKLARTFAEQADQFLANN
jgi:hypothetical protein